MRVILQRVSSAQVVVEAKVTGRIDKGFVVLVGFEASDTIEDIQWMTSKITGMRIFNDDEGKMNLSIQDVGGNILLISQFTLYASTKKGNRPSFINAAKPAVAIPLYEQTKASLQAALGSSIQTGIFGADMKVSLVNDGPVTISLDSKNKS